MSVVQGRPEETESWVEIHLVEGTEVRSAYLEVVHHLVEMEERASLFHLEEESCQDQGEARLAYRKAAVAFL